jgi:pyrroline-5-carboxylate reductase
MNDLKKLKICILGGGNIGQAMAKGFVTSGQITSNQIILTRRKLHLLEPLMKQGFTIQVDNCDAIRKSEIIILAVQPQQLKNLVHEISQEIDVKKHIIISVVSGVNCSEISTLIGKKISVIRAMPTIAITVLESMTCITSKDATKESLELTTSLFNIVGKTMIIDEDQMIPATALCACGVAFFLRAIRAASQGGIEIGFHSHEAIPMAAQTARGAATLLLDLKNHPEMEIDKVTTPEGCTITGLNEMEHQGFSSAMIKGIKSSSEKATKLYKKNDEEK